MEARVVHVVAGDFERIEHFAGHELEARVRGLFEGGASGGVEELFVGHIFRRHPTAVIVLSRQNRLNIFFNQGLKFRFQARILSHHRHQALRLLDDILEVVGGR